MLSSIYLHLEDDEPHTWYLLSFCISPHHRVRHHLNKKSVPIPLIMFDAEEEYGKAVTDLQRLSSKFVIDS
jgi:hypothetical protein